VVRIDFTAGNENVWLWVDPELDAIPDIGAADASGTAVAFEADFVRAQLQTPEMARFDEIHIGTTFGDVAPFVVPEPSSCSLVLIGMLGLAGASRILR